MDKGQELREKWQKHFEACLYGAFAGEPPEGVSFRFAWKTPGDEPDQIIVEDEKTTRTYACSRDIELSIVWACQAWADLKGRR